MVPIWDFPGGCPAAYARATDRDRSRRGSPGRGATMRVRPSAVACLALAAALAREIAAHRPALVGLQEVALWRTQICTPPCGDGPWNPATTVAYDFLQLLLDALQARGLAYTATASVVNFDGELTGARGNDYRYTDRDAIIALQGVQIANARGGNFDAAASYDVGGFPVTITRGWVSVDATVDGTTFRFASAHPDDADVDAHGAQAEQFLDEVATTLPLIAVGDFNSHPPPGETRPAYGILTAPATGLSGDRKSTR